MSPRQDIGSSVSRQRRRRGSKKSRGDESSVRTALMYVFRVYNLYIFSERDYVTFAICYRNSVCCLSSQNVHVRYLIF